jgi:hypothetical protein
MEESRRNHEIRNLLDIWEWCSRTLRVKWKRKRRYRNNCLIGLAGAVNESHVGLEVSPYELPLVYETLAAPLFDGAGLLAFWETFPTSLLEMCLGCFTKESPLAERLDRVRLTRQDNPVLDKLFKKMSKREERFGYDWLVKGHHPETEFVQLKREMAPLCAPLKKLILGECAAVQALARELLAQGPWQMGNLPASSFVRKTPESLLNRAVRLKLWLVAQEILSQGLEGREELEALCNGLYPAITPSVKAAIESQGYTADKVVDDFLNFDMRKSRKEITEKQAR